jgi:hypothetical protein
MPNQALTCPMHILAATDRNFFLKNLQPDNDMFLELGKPHGSKSNKVAGLLKPPT